MPISAAGGADGSQSRYVPPHHRTPPDDGKVKVWEKGYLPI